MSISIRLGIAVAVLAIATAATTALGAGITSIGVLAPAAGGTAESAVHAISPNGTYAVGYSNGPNTDSSATIQQPVIWSAGTGLVQLPNVTNTDGQANGVVVRNSDGTIGIGGGFMQTVSPFKRQMYYYKAPQANLASGTWTDNAYGLGGIVGPYNVARLRTGYATDPWFIAGDRTNLRDFVQGVDGAPSLDHRNTGDCISNSVAGNGQSAGSDAGNPSAARRAVFMNVANGTVQTVIPGGNGVLSDALGINVAATVLSGYDGAADGTRQGFVWKVGDAGMTLLGTLPADTLSTAITVNLIGGNVITGGFSSDGTTERAVMWDNTGIWDNTGQAKLVTDLLAAAGISTSDWSSLTRVTTMTDDGMTIAGYGVWAADLTTRGFIATIPEPATATLLVLGGLALLRRRR